MGSLTDVFVAVRSDMDPFKKGSKKGLKDSEKDFEQSGKNVGKVFADAATASAKSKIEDLSKKVSAAAGVQADAAGKVRVAEAKLAEVRANGKAKAAQIIAAEEALASAQRKSAAASKATESATSALEKARTAAAQTAGKAGDAAGDSFAGHFKKSVEKAEPAEEGKKAGDRFGVGFSQKLPLIGGRVTSFFKTGFGAAAGLAAGAVLGGSVVQGFQEALAKTDTTAKFQGQLGLSDAAAAKAGKTAGDLFKANYGDSVGTVNEAIKSVVQNTNVSLNSIDLKPVTAKVLNLASTFDQDLGGVTRATGQLMRTGLAKNATEALDIITRGFQSGADKSEDFLDTLNEYGTQFRKLGINGATATGIISQGLKAGARDGDLVADALKEFSIRAIDGSDSTREGFKALGIEADKMSQTIAKGGKPAAAGLDQVLDRLRKVKDPVKQSQIAVQLFGTQAEDLGKALFAIDPSTAVDGLGKVAGAADQLDKTLGSTPAATVASFFRTLKQNSIDTFGGVITAFTSGETKATGFQGVLEKLAIKGREVFDGIKLAVASFTSGFNADAETMKGSGFAGFFQDVGIKARQAFDYFKSDILPRLREFGGYLRDTLIPTLREWAGDTLEKVRGVLTTVKQAIQDNRPQLEQLGNTAVKVGKWFVENLIPFLAKMSNETLPILGGAIRRGIDTVGHIIDAFNLWKTTTVNVLSAIWVQISGFFANLLDGAEAAFGWIPGIGPKLKQAQAAFKKFRDDVNNKLLGINDQEITVTARLNAANIGGKNDNDRRLKGSYAGGGRPGLSGKIRGPGTPTSDSIDARVSRDEWIIKASSSKGYGDHAMASVNNGTATIIPGFASGGRAGLKVGVQTDSTSTFAAAVAAAAKAAVRPAAQAIANSFGGLIGTMNFGRSQEGKPYVWGASGPNGYDCSGFVSALINYAKGRNPYKRLGATGSMPWGEMTSGNGPFTVGWFNGNPGHTAATINGVNFESRGGRGVVVGSAARGSNDPLFTNRAKVKGFAKGGRPGLGDLPYDLLNPQGKDFVGKGVLKQLGVGVYDGGGRWPSGTLGVNLSGKTETVTTGDGAMHLDDATIRKLADAIADRPVLLDGRRVDAAMSRTANGGGF